jgi:hypothetical protein
MLGVRQLMQPSTPGSKLFHTIVVVGLSFVATGCGSIERASATADGAPPSPDGFPDDTGQDATSEVEQALTGGGETGPLAPDGAADAGDAGDEGDACTELCCRPGTWGSRVPCGTCVGVWPCYV